MTQSEYAALIAQYNQYLERILRNTDEYIKARQCLSQSSKQKL